MLMYRKKFVPSGADLGVGGGPCRFQRAAGLWALKALGCEGVCVVLGCSEWSWGDRQLRVMAWLQRSEHIMGFGLGCSFISSLTPPHQPMDNRGSGGEGLPHRCAQKESKEAFSQEPGFCDGGSSDL